MKTLSGKSETAFSNQIILMLLNSREQTKDHWNVNNPYFAEAFGMLRCLVALGYCNFGPANGDNDGSNANAMLESYKNIALKYIENHGYSGAIQMFEDKCNRNTKK